MKYLKLFERYKADYQDLYDINHNPQDYKDGIDTMEEMGEKFINKIQSLINGETMIVYREMSVYGGGKWIDTILNGDNKSLGNFWAYDKEIAHSWEGYDVNKPTNVLLTSEINTKDIDWYNTMELFFIFGGNEMESELSLRHDTDFKLLTIEEIKDNKIIRTYTINKSGFTM
tara:strand:- start:881 stop:1396 length:516 start_codon:yes stop_codon:yes gene_type:complete